MKTKQLIVIAFLALVFGMLFAGCTVKLTAEGSAGYRMLQNEQSNDYKTVLDSCSN